MMKSEAGKNPLPSGPSNLCFNKEEFMKDGFYVDQFVMECRRKVALETLRDDLHVYLKILQSAMIELINKDYADFVNLSTNLVGFDKAINNLTVPLGQLKEEIMIVRTAMDEAAKDVDAKIQHQTQIREKKACLQRLMNINQSVEKIEQLVGIQHRDPQTTTYYTSELSGQLIERVATEFNKLQFYVNKSRGLPLVENIKPRIANITSTLQYSLEGSFREGLKHGDTEILQQCLRTYATIDKMRDAENLFRQYIVKPYMEELIGEQYLHDNSPGQGLRAMYAVILDFIPKHCKKLKEVTSGDLHSGGEVVRGYDFLVNAVWPEIVANIEARTPSIFAPGNPNSFHEKYTISMEFVDKFEKQCGSHASCKRLRAHSSYNIFMSKWSLPVYFQIRFQEIAGAFETALTSPFNISGDNSLFHLHSSLTVWNCMHQCWNKEIYLMPLCHRFWKLTLQLLARYTAWIEEVQDMELHGVRNGTEESCRVGNGEPNGAESPSVPVSPPITMGQIVCLISDAHLLTNKIPGVFKEVIQPYMTQLGLQDHSILLESLEESQETLRSKLPRFGSYIVDEIAGQCLLHLKLVNDIPRLFRRTNREVPVKASTYVASLLKPIKMFKEEHHDVLEPEKEQEWNKAIVISISEQYYAVTSEVLTSVKKMEESLKRLKKARGTSSPSGGLGMSDDDKIRLQLYLDVQDFGEQIDTLGINKSELQAYTKLFELVESAKKASSS